MYIIIKSDPNTNRRPHFLKLISVQCVIRPCRATFPPQINSRACTAIRHSIVVDIISNVRNEVVNQTIQILERHDMAEDSTRQANLETTC